MPPGLAELQELERILAAGARHIEIRVLGEASAGAQRFPLYAVLLGSRADDAPAVGFFGGVHGLERIGTQVLLGYLGSLVRRLAHDEPLAGQLAAVRLVFMPLVNPAGMHLGRRSNAQGIDLMRNAPLDAAGPAAFLVGGQFTTQWTRYAEEAPVGLDNALRQLLAAARYRAPDRPPAVPLLLLAGRGDRLVDPRCAERLARRWQAPLRVHPTAGHDHALDAGAWVADEVARWLATCRW